MVAIVGGSSIGYSTVLHVLVGLHLVFFFQAEDGIRDGRVTGVQTCALPISPGTRQTSRAKQGSDSGIWSGQEGSVCQASGRRRSQTACRPSSISLRFSPGSLIPRSGHRSSTPDRKSVV